MAFQFNGKRETTFRPNTENSLSRFTNCLFPHEKLLLIKPRISVHLRHLTWIMPVQDLPKTLKCLLDVLVDVNTLQSWNIFEEKNCHVVVKLRFNSGHYSPPSKEPVLYKRKASSQVKRDGDRLATYRRNQAKAAGDHDHLQSRFTSPTHVEISVNKPLIAESQLQQLNGRPDQ